jgi:hypothetical protein
MIEGKLSISQGQIHWNNVAGYHRNINQKDVAEGIGIPEIKWIIKSQTIGQIDQHENNLKKYQMGSQLLRQYLNAD